jgi:hypothetical protein
MMRADYDSAANAISVVINDGVAADSSDEVHPRAIVALDHGRPVELQILYPDRGISEPVAAASARYDLDGEAIEAAAQSAFVAPDRVVTVDVQARAIV